MTTPSGGGGGRGAGGDGGLRSMLGGGLGAGLSLGRVARSFGAFAGVASVAAIGTKSVQRGRQAAETVAEAKAAGLSPSDYAALKVATDRYGESILKNTEKLTTAMREIKASGEVLTDTQLNKLAKDSTDLARSMAQLGNALQPVQSGITGLLASLARGATTLADRAKASLIILSEDLKPGSGSIGTPQSLENRNWARAVLAGLPPPEEGTTPVDQAAVDKYVAGKAAATRSAAADLRLNRPSGDPMSRIGLFNEPGTGPYSRIITIQNELLKATKGVEAGVKQLNTNVKGL
jgi:hypothetical protein